MASGPVLRRQFVDGRVRALAINVETFHGTVQLSGFAKSENERVTAESIASEVPNVKSVKNDIVVRP